MRNVVKEAEILFVLLSEKPINPGERQAIFCLYYRVRETDPNIAQALLRDSGEVLGLFARQKRKLKTWDNYIASV